MPGIFRLTPLPQSYKRMKMDYYTHWQQRGFEGYKSPWIPVWEGNVQHIQRGDLIIDLIGFEQPALIGRDWQKVKNGRVINILERHGLCDQQNASFVWVDYRHQNLSKYLNNSPFAEAYRKYSELMEDSLRNGYIRVEDVRFPLFHETDPNSAENILENGVDHISVVGRNLREFGVGFCTCPSFKDTIGKGNLRGAIVEFGPWQGESPKLLIPYTYSLTDLDCFFGDNDPFNSSPLMRYPCYTWRTVCAELSATSIQAGSNVYIYDSFEEYVPTKIHRNYT